MDIKQRENVPEEAHKQDLDYITTDSGNADRLVREHGQDFRYCDALGGWLTWTGVRWQADDAAIWDCARSVGKSIQREAVEATDKNDADRLWQHGRYTLSEPGLRRMIGLASKDSGVRVLPEDFDKNPYLLNVWNGTVDVRTGMLGKHDRNDLITKLAPVAYDTGADAPTFMAFIERVLPDKDVRKYVQKAIGQALTGAVDEQAFYLNQGIGDNGKNTLYDAILTLLGEYADVINIEVLMEKGKAGNASPELAKLRGKRFVVASESTEGQRLNPGLIKKLTGDMYITARDLYKSSMTFERQFKLFMHVNHLPDIGDNGYAMWKRVRLIPWTVRIPAGEKDKQLPIKLGQEMSGILNWALMGYGLYAVEGLDIPEAIEAATKQYRHDNDKLAQFIAEECDTGDVNLYVKKDNLYNLYKQWCVDNNLIAESKNRFGKRMLDKEYADERRKLAGKTERIWVGIGPLGE